MKLIKLISVNFVFHINVTSKNQNHTFTAKITVKGRFINYLFTTSNCHKLLIRGDNFPIDFILQYLQPSRLAKTQIMTFERAFYSTHALKINCSSKLVHQILSKMTCVFIFNDAPFCNNECRSLQMDTKYRTRSCTWSMQIIGWDQRVKSKLVSNYST